jgi:hypothetical protein
MDLLGRDGVLLVSHRASAPWRELLAPGKRWSIMSIRIYKLEGGGGAKGAALAVVIVGAGVLLVGVGLALLLALGTAGALIGAGVMVYRRLMGQSRVALPHSGAKARLDPALEVFAEDVVIDGRRRLDEPPEALPPG